MTSATAPSLRHERRLIREGSRTVVGIDEVGRGALAGPVTVGAVLVDERSKAAPAGVRDSKDLTARRRQDLRPRLESWAVAHAVGHAGPDEIDRWGILPALRVAALRALTALDVAVDAILLDGSHDWLSDAGGRVSDAAGAPRVVTRVKADRHCSSVAAASVLAKVARDALMAQLGGEDDPYRWAHNVGYSAPEHLKALADLGPGRHHRLSWVLPGVSPERAAAVDPIRAARRLAEGEQLVLSDVPVTTGSGR